MMSSWAMEVDKEAEEDPPAAVAHAKAATNQDEDMSDDDSDDDDDHNAIEGEKKPAAAVVAAAAADEDEEEAVAAVVVDDDDDDGAHNDSDHEEAQEATMVEATKVDDDDEAEEAVVNNNGDNSDDDDQPLVKAEPVVAAVPIVEKKKSNKKSTNAKKKKPGKKKKATTTTTPKKKTSTTTGATSGKSPASKKKKGKKKKKGSNQAAKGDKVLNKISSKRLDVAAQARDLLVKSVPRLPLAIGNDTYVRSFGNLYVEPATTTRSKFSSANALYPVGFSCDRYEFSPAHGRILKLRCSILDGRKMKETQRFMGIPFPANHLPDGPVFRIMWGPGIDEDVEDVEYPYDPYSMSAPLTAEDEVDAVAIPTTANGTRNAIIPKEGMRVSVKFDQDESYSGTILKVNTSESNNNATSSAANKKKRKQVEIQIKYDDGAFETANFPDPDISLQMPGKFS